MKFHAKGLVALAVCLSPLHSAMAANVLNLGERSAARV